MYTQEDINIIEWGTQANEPPVAEHKPLGERYNSDKAPVSMVLEAPHAIEGCAKVLCFGANKYARANWRKGLLVTEIIDSLARHLIAFTAGEDSDQDSGLPHVDHIMCNALFLAEMYHTREDLDDRPIKGEGND